MISDWFQRSNGKRAKSQSGPALRVHVEAADSVDHLPEVHKTCIYRVVQEALNNFARHAHAQSAEVEVSEQEGKILLTIVDDGVGFDAAQVRGLGLVGMEERVTHLGGVFHVYSEQTKGTRIYVELPLGAAGVEHVYAADSNTAG